MPEMARSGLDEVLALLEAHAPAHVEELQEFVRIPSVSAQPERQKDVRRGAEWLMARLRRAGMENVGLVETSGHPAVVADWLHAEGAPTVLVYGHYDVQPAEAADGWAREPFGGDLAEGRIWGRGTTDDKGQLMCHVLAAEAWLSAIGGLPVNLKMVFEGEEEIGSLHFGEVVDKAAPRLQADVLLVSDSRMAGEDRPALIYALRGLVYLQVDVQGPAHDLHSGVFGGAVRNPLEALVHMLAACKNPETGIVRVPGFYDNVVTPTPKERQELEDVGITRESVLRDTGCTAAFGENGWSTMERMSLRPTFEINGVWGGYMGEGTKTVIPAAAHAKVSCRLVADQDPHRIGNALERHLRDLAPEGIQVRVTHMGPSHPVRTDPHDPMLQAVGRALEAAFGEPPVRLPEGGTIPAVAMLQRRLGVRPAMAGFGQQDENMHGPDESMRLHNIERGKQAAARMLLELAQG